MTTNPGVAAPTLLASWFNKPSAKPAQGHVGALSAADIIQGLSIEGSPSKYQSVLLLAKSHGKVLGAPEDVGLVGLRWFRAREGNEFDPIDVRGSALQPSVDDVGCRLCVQCYDLKDETQAHFVEFGPMALDPKTLEAARARKVSLKAVSLELHELFLEREGDGPITLRDGSKALLVDSLQWVVVPSEPKKVVYDKRDLYFASHAERDVATLLVRSHSTPPHVASHTESPAVGGGDYDAVARIAALERDLADTRLQLAAAAMANKARNGAAETGKALAEATALRREVDKLTKDNASLAQQLAATRAAKEKAEADAATASERERACGDAARERDEATVLLAATRARLGEAIERADKAERALGEAKDSVPVLKARAERAEMRANDLEAKLAAALGEADKAHARRNAAQQKADSLSKDMARLLRATPGGLEEVEEIVRQNHALAAQLEEVRAELKQARAAVPSVASAGAGKPAVRGKDRELGTLANSLMGEVKEKDEMIEALRAENAMLNVRVKELLKQPQRRRDDGAA